MEFSVSSPLSRLAWGCLGAALLAGVSLDSTAASPLSNRETVGHKEGGRSVTPVNQTLTPLGRQIELTGLRPQALALSPDGSRLLVSGKTSQLLVLSPVTGEILQRVALPSEQVNEPQPAVPSPNILKPDAKGQVSYTGLIYSPDGKRVFLSNVNGSLKVFRVDPDGSIIASHSLPLPAAGAPRRKEEIPSGLAMSADGRRLYVCANLSNRLLELDADTGKVLREFRVGVAPYEVVLVGDAAYVSNWGGRRPGPDDLTGPAGRGTTVRVDPVRHIASEGSVSIIDLKASAESNPLELITGLHASALAVSPDRRHVVCANAGSDTLSVIDTRTRTVVETIWAKTNPADLFGASPNALAFAPDGKTLYVANGSQNAIAVVRFDPGDRESRLAGLIPVGWFPGALVHDTARKQLLVANVKGMPSKMKKADTAAEGFNSHQYNGTLSMVPLPSRRHLGKLSETVSRNVRREAIVASRLPPRSGVKPRPIPERIGEPSVFKHVIYVIKENRTYDQVLG
ncbi:MAG: hypothetical protein RIS56_1722, partial [Verrucomicrobiota bacterium]